jgi:hypothetical protein
MSIQRIVAADYNEFTPPAGVTDYDTHHNHMPGPYHEISWHEYQHRANIWSPRWREFRQVAGLPGFSSTALPRVRIEWYWFGGLATVAPSRWRIANEQDAIDDPLVELGSTFYREPARYFYVGCPHKWRRMTDEELAARGWHKIDRHDQIEVCVDCGMPQRYDTSG